MKPFYIIISVLLFSQSSFALTIITDLDDTFKITNVSDLSEATRNALFSKKAFLQFPNLLNEMDRYTNGLFIVSGSPTFLRGRIDKFLEHHKVISQDVILRNLIKDKDTLKYKIEQLKRIFRQSPGESFILIGDDTEHDPEVYKRLKDLFPDQVEDIYIRAIKNISQPEFIKPFYTAFDIALHEYKKERMGMNEVLLIGKSFLFAKDLELALPDFAFCPSKKTDFKVTSILSLSLLHKQINHRLMKYCLSR